MFLNDKDINFFVAIAVVLVFLLGMAVAHLIPMAWEFIKPIIHEATK